MSDPWLPLLGAYWAHLAGDAEYVALGLSEFKHSDGNLLPFDPKKNDYDYTKCPLHGIDVLNAGTVPAGQKPGSQVANIGSLWRPYVKFAGVVAFSTVRTTDKTAAVLTNAMRIIINRLHGRGNFLKLVQALGALGQPNTANAEFYFDEGFIPLRDNRDGTGPVQQWVWPYQAVLYGANAGVI